MRNSLEHLQETTTSGALARRDGERPQRQGPLPRLGRALQLATLAVDALAAAAALVALGVVRGPLSGLAVPALAVAWLPLLHAWGAYRRGLGYTRAAEAKAVFLAGLSGGLFLLALGPAAGLSTSRPAGVALALPIVLLAVGRLVLRVAGTALRRRGTLVRRALLVGHGPDAAELLDNLGAWPGLGVEVVGICADTPEPFVFGLPVLGPSRSCNVIAHDLGLQTVLLAPGSIASATCSKISGDLLRSDVEVVLTPNAPQLLVGRLSPRQLGGMPVLRLERRGLAARSAVKRGFDLAAAGTLVVLLAPLFGVLSLLIRLDTPGPVFFRQRRIGKNGAAFTVWKFRTMRSDAESLLVDLCAENGEAPLFKLKDDPRVTRVGRWLRRTSLDELPQLVNVLLGHMSLVGPRPALPHEVATFDDLTLRRLRVTPGMTGLWQVSGRAEASFATYSRMDAFYAENWTLLGDLRILLRTIPVVLSRKGAY